MEDAGHWAEAVREQDEKLVVLHEARMDAYDEMRRASTAHQFLDRAYESARSRRREFVGMLQMAVEKEAWDRVGKDTDQSEKDTAESDRPCPDAG